MTPSLSIENLPQPTVRRRNGWLEFRGLNLANEKELRRVSLASDLGGELTDLSPVSKFLIGSDELHSLSATPYGRTGQLLMLSGLLDLDTESDQDDQRIYKAVHHFRRQHGGDWLGERVFERLYAGLMGCLTEESWLHKVKMTPRLNRMLNGELAESVLPADENMWPWDFGSMDSWVRDVIPELESQVEYEQLLTRLGDPELAARQLVNERMREMLITALTLWQQREHPPQSLRGFVVNMHQLEFVMKGAAAAAFYSRQPLTLTTADAGFMG